MKPILVPTDFSNNANNALKYASAFAQAMHSTLILLNVYTPAIGKYKRIRKLFSEEIADAKNQSKKRMNRLCNKHAKMYCSFIVEVGNPVSKIISAAKKEADLIIMGTHGASGLKRILFGSNTSEVLSKSKIPVLAIPQRYHFKPIKTIVYATDMANTISELKHIIPIAKQLDATIEILNFDYGWEENAGKKTSIEKKIKALSYKKIIVIEQKANIEKSVLEQIKNYLKKRKPEMLVMFPKEKTWFDTFFIGSNTEAFAFDLKVPLLSIRKSIVK